MRLKAKHNKMKRTEKCVLCQGAMIQEGEILKCNACGATHDSSLFNYSNKKRNKHFRFSALKILFALIGALYLFYFALRVFIY